MSKLIVWRFLTSNLRTNKADIKEINLKLIKVTPSYGSEFYEKIGQKQSQ
jgi:hypothetical protein